MGQSIRTIDSPEFINLQPLDLNPLMSSCEIKVLYVGQNRNGSFISKEVATEMSKTLRGAPIVGYFRQEKEDFGDHGDKITIDCDGVHVDCMTKPYGFVSPNADVWFQNFDDVDDFGNTVTREYLMTNGYLWTGQFEECKIAVEEGRPQSMELDNDSLEGHWSLDNKTGMEFFIINDAIFSKLCILGEDVEPCFEGASIAAPSTYSLDKDFRQTLFSMMQDLKKFEKEGGNNKMDKEKEEEKKVSEEEKEKEKEKDETSKEQEQKSQESSDEKTQEMDETSKEKKEEDKKVETKSSLVEQSVYDKLSCEYASLETAYNELSDKYTSLENQYQELLSFKNAVDNEKKDALIETFSALSQEEKADVIQNKEKYSYDEIEAKLSILYTHKIMNNPLKKEAKEIISTFTVDNSSDNLPAWLRAVRENEKNL